MDSSVPDIITHYRKNLESLEFPNIRALSDDDLNKMMFTMNPMRRGFLLWILVQINDCLDDHFATMSQKGDMVVVKEIIKVLTNMQLCSEREAKQFVLVTSNKQDQMKVWDKLLMHVGFAAKYKHLSAEEKKEQHQISHQIVMQLYSSTNLKDVLRPNVNLLPLVMKAEKHDEAQSEEIAKQAKEELEKLHVNLAQLQFQSARRAVSCDTTTMVDLKTSIPSACRAVDKFEKLYSDQLKAWVTQGGARSASQNGADVSEVVLQRLHNLVTGFNKLMADHRSTRHSACEISHTDTETNGMQQLNKLRDDTRAVCEMSEVLKLANRILLK